MQTRVLVVGAGAVGLRTALELARRKVNVVLRAPRHPVQDSCSVGAGGLWMPFHCDDPRVDKWALETLDELLPQAAESSDQTLPLVEIITKIVLHRTSTPPNELPAWSRYERLEFQHLSVEELSSQNAAIHGFRIPPLEELVDAGYRFAWMFQTPIVNTARMLEFFLHELENDHDGVNVNVETGQVYASLSQLQGTAKELECQAIVNCAGMGARQLVPDPQVVPARGALYHFKRDDCPRRPEIFKPLQSLPKSLRDVAMSVQEAPWGNETHPAYMIPRGADLVVGGTYLEGDEERSIRPQEREHLLQNAHNLGIDVSSCRPIGEWVGFRPYRNPVRCEFDIAYNGNNNIPIFHSYGHGGSGWTVNVGSAKECADKLLDYFDNQCHDDATHGVPSSGLPSSADEI